MFEIDPGKKKKQKEIGKQGVEAAFVKAIRFNGGKAFKFTSEQNRGVTDRIVILPGQMWFVEIKREGGKLTLLQKDFKAYIKSMGLNHFTVYGKNGIKEFLGKVL